jgi:hypothetical protein
MTREIATRRFERGFINLIDQGFDLSNIQHFWGYKNTSDTKRQISIYKLPNQINTAELTIKIKNNISPFDTYIKELPGDINNVIFSFLRRSRVLKYSIHYTDEYPFIPPKWTLMEYKLNGENQLNDIRKTFELLYCDGREWSPAITMENEILMFISSIPWFN